MNILVTGGTGFIGKNLLKKLVLSNNVNITLLKRKLSNINDSSITNNKNLQIVNIEEIDDFDIFFKTHRTDLVIHLSSKYVKYDETAKDIEEMNYFNISLPSKILFAAVKNGLKGFINTGSFFEYKQKNGKLSEQSELKPFNYYAATKIAFEEILKYFSEIYGIHSATLKLFSPYGPGQKNKIIPLMISTAINNKKLILTSGQQKLCFTYIDDIVDAYLKAINYLFSPKYTNYESFNIGANSSYSIREVAMIVSGEADIKKSLFVFGGKQITSREIMLSLCDNTKAKNVLGWKPKIEVEEGIKKTLENFKKSI